MGLTRRAIVAGAPALGAACATAPPRSGRHYDAVVIGAGVFGAWCAEHLRRAGKRVLLVDQMGPANARGSSGGETRMTRSTYGANRIYTEMALSSLGEWRALSERSALPLFHQTGVLFLFQDLVDYARDAIAVHREIGLALNVFDAAELSRRWPQIDYEGISFGLHEPGFGPLMARRGVQELVAEFVGRGGDFRVGRGIPDPSDGHMVQINGERLRAEAVVYACGPWLPALFPEVIGQRIVVERQEVAFVAPPNGDRSYEPDALPGWADYNNGDLYYGFPNLEGRGFKIAHDAIGPRFDPESGDRRMSTEGAALLRAFMARRFPALATQLFTEFRVCQSEKSASGDFLIDRHPTLDGAFLLGAGSAHGFKHGPEVGRLMAELALGRDNAPDPRFALAAMEIAESHGVL